MKYIVTGTGRCGTVYMARFLTSLGIPCGHESVYNLTGEKCLSEASIRDGKWVDLEHIIADSSYMAAPFLDQIEAQIIHVVRHPFKVINSFCNHIDYFQQSKPTNNYEEFMHHHLPDLSDEMEQYDRAALFYIQWNKMIESDFFHRIEDDKFELLAYLGCEGDHFHDPLINTYRKGSRQFDISMLQNQEIKTELIALGQEYGYDMSSKRLFI